MQDLSHFNKDFALFLECGFIAVNQTDEEAAEKLFEASHALRPKNLMPEIGYGYMHLMKLELKQACEKFESILKKEPDNKMAKALLGISLCFTPKGVAKGEKYLHETQKSRDSEVKKLSETALDFVDHYLKKAPSPAEIQKPKKHAKKQTKKKK